MNLKIQSKFNQIFTIIIVLLSSSLLLVQSFNLDRNTNVILKEIISSSKNSTELLSSSAPYRIFTSENSLEILLDEIEHFQLILEPKLSINSTEKIHGRFYCEDGDENTFSWSNNNETNCNILEIKPKFQFDFEPSGSNSKNPKNFTIHTINPGKQTLVVHAKLISSNKNQSEINASAEDGEDFVDTIKAYIKINVGRSNSIIVIGGIIGWIYFFAWSISFYPQNWDNFKRKSVVGLNFDFLALNITGFLSYSVFNIALYFIPIVQEQYEERYPRSQIPVELNDVVFAIHAVFATIICIVQCFIYERGTQTISLFCKIFLGIVWPGYLILGILTATTNLLNVLDYIYIFSYVKLVITIIKYIPQGYYNFKRKSTIGWSIGNIFLDFTGGSLSILQMILSAYNYDDWKIFTNFTKFGLGAVSIGFDIFFILQHYVFYRHSRNDSELLLTGGNNAINDGGRGSNVAVDNISYDSNNGNGGNGGGKPMKKGASPLYGSTGY